MVEGWEEYERDVIEAQFIFLFQSEQALLVSVPANGKAVFSCQAVSGPDDGKVELLSKVTERFDITGQRRHYRQKKAGYKQ